MPPRPIVRLLAVAGTLTAILVPAASAAASDPGCTRYAARDGSDSNPGTESAPKLTVQALVNSLKAGETGCLRAGTYTETSNGYIARFATGGTPAAPITLRSYAGERARIVGIVNVTDTASAVHIADLDIEGTGGSNTVKVYAPDVVVEGNTITNAHRGLSCMMLGSNSGAGQATRVLVRRNVLQACGSPANGNKDHAIYASNVLDGEIVENLIVDPSAWAIQLYPNAHRTRFAHNVVDGGGSVRGGVVFGGDTSYTSTDNVVENNVLTFAATYELTSSWGGVVGSNNIARDNCVYGAGSAPVGSVSGWTNQGTVVADPRFLGRSAGDYRLATDSPCLGVVGYDTVRAMGGAPISTVPAADPTPTPTPDPTVSPTPDPAPTPVPTPTTVNQPPTVSLIEPLADAHYLTSLAFAADAADDVAVSKVEFYVDQTLVATDSVAPYVRSVKLPRKLRLGRHTVVARAYDEAGLSTSTAPVAVIGG